MTMIRTANSRLRRGVIGIAEKKLKARAEQLGFSTKSGFISKSKKVLSSKQLKKAFEEYEQEHYEEKQDTNYQKKQDFADLVSEYIRPSEWWQIMNTSNSPNEFATRIIAHITIYNTFEEEYQREFIEWLEEQYKMTNGVI